MSVDDLLAKYLTTAVEEHARLEEEACERALVTGNAGVAAVQDEHSKTWYVTTLVPWGELYSFPTRESFMIWREKAIAES